MVEDSTPLYDSNSERWTDLVDKVGEPLQQHIPASSKPSRGGSEMGWSYVLGALTGLYVWHDFLSYLVAWSSQQRMRPAISSPASSWRKCPAPAIVSGGATFWKMLQGSLGRNMRCSCAVKCLWKKLHWGSARYEAWLVAPSVVHV